jgi:hypothetical protein
MHHGTALLAACALAATLAIGCTEHTIYAPSPDPPVALALVETTNALGQPDSLPHTRQAHGTTVQFDGTQSYDPTHPDYGYDWLEFDWQFQVTPPGSAPELTYPHAVPDTGSVDMARPAFVPDAPGTYRMSLRVTNAEDELTSVSSYVTVQVTDIEDLVIDLYWTTPATDVDLHVIAPNGEYWTDEDCYYGNPNPDWGVPGAGIDNPLYGEDDDNGGDEANPAHEQVSIQAPASGHYTVVVTYHSDRHTSQTVSPWVEVTMAGEEVTPRVDTPAPLEEFEAWQVMDIDVPDLDVIVLDEITTHEAIGGPPIND